VSIVQQIHTKRQQGHLKVNAEHVPRDKVLAVKQQAVQIVEPGQDVDVLEVLHTQMGQVDVQNVMVR
jgi:hypothetical protein